jgi:hypothetical protein
LRNRKVMTSFEQRKGDVDDRWNGVGVRRLWKYQRLCTTSENGRPKYVLEMRRKQHTKAKCVRFTGLHCPRYGISKELKWIYLFMVI